MKKMSLQWRLTCIITIYIAVICGCLTMLVYKNGVYYIDSLKETVGLSTLFQTNFFRLFFRYCTGV